MKVFTFLLDGGSILVISGDRWETTRNEFHQGGCPLRLARTIREQADRIEDWAKQMGATQEKGW